MSPERVGRTGPGRGAGSLPDRSELRGAAAGVVAGFGAFFAVSYAVTAAGRPAASGLYDAPFVLLSVALLYAGYWLLRCDFPHRRVARVALWSLSGFVALVSVGVWLAGGRAVGAQSAATLAVEVGTVGASSGLLVGLCGERRRRRLDRDNRVAVERVEEQLAFFNRMLRHHLLNGVAVVRGHADLLAEGQTDPSESVEIIRRRSDEIVHLVRNVETLSRAYTGDMPVRAVDPGPAIRAAIESVQEGDGAVDVRGDYSDGDRVRANDRLPVIFEAVLDETLAVAGEGGVTVETSKQGGAFAASVAFDGSFVGYDGGTVDAGDHGDGALGLFVAETLVEYFGGSLELAARDSRSVLTVWLPLAD